MGMTVAAVISIIFFHHTANLARLKSVPERGAERERERSVSSCSHYIRKVVYAADIYDMRASCDLDHLPRIMTAALVDLWNWWMYTLAVYSCCLQLLADHVMATGGLYQQTACSFIIEYSTLLLLSRLHATNLE
jgi:hypothetical protein